MGPVRQANNVTIQYAVFSGAGVAQDITSWSFLFRVQLLNTRGFVIEKSSADDTQIAIIDAAAGLVDVYLVPSDSAPPFNGSARYPYDFQGTDEYGNVYTMDSGTLTFTPILLPCP